jgi:hypothetical protein
MAKIFGLFLIAAGGYVLYVTQNFVGIGALVLGLAFGLAFLSSK